VPLVSHSQILHLHLRSSYRDSDFATNFLPDNHFFLNPGGSFHDPVTLAFGTPAKPTHMDDVNVCNKPTVNRPFSKPRMQQLLSPWIAE
jgi:hypothetical protein